MNISSFHWLSPGQLSRLHLSTLESKILKRKIIQNIIIPSKLFDFVVAKIQAKINSLVVKHVIAALAHECTWLYFQFGFHKKYNMQFQKHPIFIKSFKNF